MPFPTQRLSRIALITLVPLPALFLILTFTTWLVTPPTAHAGSCNPPTTHPTIQAAVDDPSCTLITLDATNYTENVVIDRSLTIAGQAAAQQSAPAPLAGSLITGTGTLAPVIQITGGHAVTLTNLTLGGGAGGSGGGIQNNGGDLLLDGVNVVDNNVSQEGGGIFNNGGTLDITDSSIVNNSAVNPANLFGINGGGISVDTGAVAITGTLIADNSATFGAGANFFFALANISNSTIRGNDANPSFGAGGGANIDASTVALTATVVSDNSAGNGGGIKATFSIEESTVASNSAGGGGGLFIDTVVPPIVNNVVVTGNIAAQDGGGLFHVGPILTVTGSLIQNNVAGGRGGGISKIGGTMTVSVSALRTNLAANGAAMYTQFLNRLYILNTTVSENAPQDPDGTQIWADTQQPSQIVASTLVDGFPDGRRIADSVESELILIGTILGYSPTPTPTVFSGAIRSGGGNNFSDRDRIDFEFILLTTLTFTALIQRQRRPSRSDHRWSAGSS